MSEYGWENDENGTQNKQKPPQKQKKSKRPPSLDQYMDAMDKEIASTDVGKSFEKETKPKAKETPKPKVCLRFCTLSIKVLGTNSSGFSVSLGF